MEQIKLFSLNVWSGFRYHGLLRLEEYEPPHIRGLRFRGLLEELEREKPDLIFLNEVNPLAAYGDCLKRELGYEAVGHMGVAGVRAGRFGFPANLREGDLILARPSFALERLGRRHLGGRGYCGDVFSCHFDNLTQAVLARVTLPGSGRPLYCCVTHWVAAPAVCDGSRRKAERLARKWGFPPRALAPALDQLERIQRTKLTEARRLTAWLNRIVPPDAPLVVAGDFNAEADWPELRALTDAGFSCLPFAYNGFRTWDPAHNTNLQTYYVGETKIRQKDLFHQLDAEDELVPRDLDHFFTRGIPASSVADCHVCATARVEGRSISDHFGIAATLRQ